MEFMQEILEKAKKVNGTIILPEANMDERVMSAARKIIETKLSKIIVLGREEQFDDVFQNNEFCEIIDIEKYEQIDDLINSLYELRKNKGMTIEQAKELIKEPIYFAMMLLKLDKADGIVAGAKYTTANVLRPALQIIKTKPNKSIVTGIMLMVKEEAKPLVYGDVSLIENPSSEELSEIAISCAEFYEKMTDSQPKVAMLSYSTKGSAKSEMVDKMQKATDLAKSKSNYLIDGEMQADCALDKETAQKKGITSEVGGNANVLIYPDLNAGNIAYKLTQRLGGYSAIGPIMLNFNKPVNDLSRGCNVDEIVNTVCITKLQIE